VTPCRLEDSYPRRFGDAWYFHIQGKAAKKTHALREYFKFAGNVSVIQQM